MVQRVAAVVGTDLAGGVKKPPKNPNPRCFGVWVVIGKKVEAKNPNGVSAKCAKLDWHQHAT
jgi:hypothetical protein